MVEGFTVAQRLLAFMSPIAVTWVQFWPGAYVGSVTVLLNVSLIINLIIIIIIIIIVISLTLRVFHWNK